MPISAVVGRADIMRLMEDIFYSGTFGGETLSLAASIAVIDKMKRESVIEALWSKGKQLTEIVNNEIKRFSLQDFFSLSGLPPWKFLIIKDCGAIPKEFLKTLFIREMLNHGVLIQGTHNVSYAHTEDDLNCVKQAYEKTFSTIQKAIQQNDFERCLNGKIIKPIFSVR